MSDNATKPRVLVTGASGYVGGRLVPRLLEEGNAVRCLARTPGKLASAPWINEVEVAKGSVEGELSDALQGIDVAVYLVHGIGDSPDWAAKEVSDAENFRTSCEQAGVSRIVYLGGMGSDDDSLSVHLTSRQSVGRTLGSGPIPLTELRAAVIIGSGSASFEMLRYLTEVLPVMVTPKWVSTKSQPIAISDVLDYLVTVINAPTPLPGVFEIGGPDVVSYAEMMAMYAQEAGLKRRRLIPVPLLTPRLSSHWVGLVTPVPASLAKPLVESLVNEVVVHGTKTVDTLGSPKRSVREAISLALGRTSSNQVPTSFTDADLRPFKPYITDPAWSGGTKLFDERIRRTSATPKEVFAAVTSLGGEKGWHRGEWLWRVRGVLDQLWGGPGVRRGRSHPTQLHIGDYVDFWRVEELSENEHVKLHAEMVLPGDAWIEWMIEPLGTGSLITQRATYKPKGLLGRLYWYVVAPFHFLVFPGLLQGITADAES